MENILKGDKKFRYQMLGRFKQDCEFYLFQLSQGSRSKNRLWALNEEEHIENMKALYNTFGQDEKPDWLSWKEIISYEEKMILK